MLLFASPTRARFEIAGAHWRTTQYTYVCGPGQGASEGCAAAGIRRIFRPQN